MKEEEHFDHILTLSDLSKKFCGSGVVERNQTREARDLI